MAFNKGEWRPTKPQEVFLSLPWSIKEAFFGGAVGGGKTDILLVYPLVNKLHENPRFKQVLLRRTFPELRNEVVPRSREIYRKFGAHFNKSDMIWTFPRMDQFGTGVGTSRNQGAMIFLGHCENEDDVHQYDSMEINLFSPDELTSSTEYIYLYIGFTRVRTSDPTLPAIIRAAGMPGGIGHTFVKKRFIDPCPEGGKIIIGRAGVKRIYVHSSLLDNPHIDPAYKQSILALPEAEKEAKLGNWNAFAGRVFDELRDKRYPDEPENALHIVEPFEIPIWWPKYIVIDWGFAAMAYIAFYAVSPSKRVYQYRELGFLKTKIAEWAPQVRAFLEKESITSVTICQSAKQDRGNEQTIQQQIEAELKIPTELSGNTPGSRISGKMLIHEYLRWKPKPSLPVAELPAYDHEYALRLYRLKGEQAYRSYLSMFDPPEPESNLPKFQIFRCSEIQHEGHPNCCPLVIQALSSCSYAKNKNNKPAEDVEEFEGDDPYDATRYGLARAERFFTEAESEFKKVQAQDALINKLSENQDWTAFSRNMNKIESNETNQIQAVARYRH